MNIIRAVLVRVEDKDKDGKDITIGKFVQLFGITNLINILIFRCKEIFHHWGRDARNSFRTGILVTFWGNLCKFFKECSGN